MIPGSPGRADRNSGPDALPSAAVLGEMVWLWSMSEMHRVWPVAGIHRWLLPPLMHRQFRIYRAGPKPVGLVTWAWLDEAAEAAYVHNSRVLTPDDWKSGGRGWLIDFVAPFGDARRIASDLRHNLFAEDVGRFLRARKGSDALGIHYVHGARATSKAWDRTLCPPVDLSLGPDVRAGLSLRGTPG